MKCGLVVVTYVALLCGCSSTPKQDLATSPSSDSGGCLYAGELHSVGTSKRAGKVVNDGSNVSVVDDPSGIPMTCVIDRNIPGGYRWDVSALTSR